MWRNWVLRKLSSLSRIPSGGVWIQSKNSLRSLTRNLHIVFYLIDSKKARARPWRIMTSLMLYWGIRSSYVFLSMNFLRRTLGCQRITGKPLSFPANSDRYYLVGNTGFIVCLFVCLKGPQGRPAKLLGLRGVTWKPATYFKGITYRWESCCSVVLYCRSLRRQLVSLPLLNSWTSFYFKILSVSLETLMVLSMLY